MTDLAAPIASLGRVARAALWCAFLALSHVGLTAAQDVLPSPPGPWNDGDLVQWLTTTEVSLVAFTVLRLVALVTVWYLALITSLVLVARVSGLRPLALAAQVVALPWARRIVNQALGAGLALTIAGGLVPAAAGAASIAANPQPVTMHLAVDPAVGQPVTMEIVEPHEPVTMEQAPDDTTAKALGIGGSIARSTVTMQVADDAATTPATWTIAPGDHLWHVAARTLTEAWNREPGDDEITDYWQALVEHNRARLAIPTDPDLVYPGQVFELPRTPPPPTE